MKKYILLFAVTLVGIVKVSAQVSGEIISDKRVCLNDSICTLNGELSGVAVYNIKVDEKGNVKIATLIPEETTLKGTPNLVRTKNVVMKLKFVKGTEFPKLHAGKVKISIVRSPELD